MPDATLMSQWVASLDIAVIERLENGCLHVVGELPQGCETVYPSLTAEVETLPLHELFPLL